MKIDVRIAGPGQTLARALARARRLATEIAQLRWHETVWRQATARSRIQVRRDRRSGE